MTSGLSFLFQAKPGVGPAFMQSLGGGGDTGDTANAGPAPDILHYLWLVAVPQIPAPSGYATLLLTTVYDEDFTAYISDLVNNSPDGFNHAAAGILGFENVAGKLPQPDALQEFIALIAERDLTQQSAIGNFVPFYPFTAAAIHAAMGGGPAADEPAAKA